LLFKLETGFYRSFALENKRLDKLGSKLMTLQLRLLDLVKKKRRMLQINQELQAIIEKLSFET